MSADTGPALHEVERALFERWVSRTYPRAELNRFSAIALHLRAGEYEYIDMELMWRAWLASKDVSCLR